MAPGIKETRLADYQPHAFHAKTVELEFELGAMTELASKVVYERRREGEDLVLDVKTAPGSMTIKRVAVNGSDLAEDGYKLDAESMTIPAGILEESNTVEIDVSLEPEKNTALSGVYLSDGIICSQCEAEGFRNIMPFIDRPDNMSIYSVKIVADKAQFPYLLSNGNDTGRGDLEDGKHFVQWHDPWPKPSYLFAIVGGDFDVNEDKFTTCSGKEVDLRIFVNKGNGNQTEHAMKSIKKAFKWDEERFDREYDLNQFNIVAVASFNMGAMENKSLNIFNSRCVLAERNTATDADFSRIEGIIGHEYFHNYSGNRVTCRDWFSLTLKEGLTVFRDQEFTSDLNSRVAKRIADVSRLREFQLPEDASPMSHPIQPDSYVEINNFYTATVYDKGAEVIRMINTIVGVAGFKKGLNLYFDRHDGQAVTCIEFVKAMEDANDVDLSQFFATWYKQAGTPVLDVKTSYNEEAKTFTLEMKQSCPPTPGQPEKKPFDIPVAVGMIGSETGSPIPAKLSETDNGSNTVVLRLTEAEQTFTFYDVSEKPVPSLLREFSAPVTLKCEDITRKDLMFLAANDTDEFVRYNSVIDLAMQILQEGATSEEDLGYLVSSLRNILENKDLDKMVGALSLELPQEQAVADACAEGEANVDNIIEACNRMFARIASDLGPLLRETYDANVTPVDGETDGEASARRALKNACLLALARSPDTEIVRELALKQYNASDNMTDRFSAMWAIRNVDCEERKEILGKFFEMYKDDRLVLNKWLLAVSQSNVPSCVDEIKAAMKLENAFDETNPNNCYSVFLGLARNFSVLHAKGGETYAFLADEIARIDKINPSVASRMVKKLTGWRKFSEPWSSSIKGQLERLVKEEELSVDVVEVVTKSLN